MTAGGIEIEVIATVESTEAEAIAIMMIVGEGIDVTDTETMIFHRYFSLFSFLGWNVIFSSLDFCRDISILQPSTTAGQFFYAGDTLSNGYGRRNHQCVRCP